MSELTPVKSPVLPKDLEAAMPQLHGDMCVEVPKFGQFDLLWQQIIEFITDGCNLTGLFKEMLCESICATTTTTTTDCLFITTDTTTTQACYMETAQTESPSLTPVTQMLTTNPGYKFEDVPAGTYRLYYLSGAMTYDNGANFYLHSNIHPSPKFNIFYNTGGNPLTQLEGPHTGYASGGTVAAVEAANAGAFVEFTHDGGDVYIKLSDSSPDHAESTYPTYMLAGSCIQTTTTSTTTSGTTTTSTTTPDNGNNALYAPAWNPLSEVFIVPTGVSSIHVKLCGAGGDGGVYNQLSVGPYGGGGGAYAECDIAVTPGEVLSIYCSRGTQNALPNGLRTFIGRGPYNPPSSYLIAAGCGGFGGSAPGEPGTYVAFGAGTSNAFSAPGVIGTNPAGGAPGGVVHNFSRGGGVDPVDSGEGGQGNNSIDCFGVPGAIRISW